MGRKQHYAVILREDERTGLLCFVNKGEAGAPP